MALTMRRTKDAVRFEWLDDEAETVVTILGEDDEGAIIRKLKRVIALVEGPEAALPPGVPEYGVLRSETHAEPPEPTNGWAKFVPPPIPGRLEGEVELVKPGEGA